MPDLSQIVVKDNPVEKENVEEKEGAFDKEWELQRARIAEQAELYEDMADSIKKVVENSGPDTYSLTNKERNLFSGAYKNLVGAARSAYEIVSTVLEQAKEDEKGRKQVGKVQTYLNSIEEKLVGICETVHTLLRPLVEQSKEEPANFIFYKKMEGDYYRYLAEIEDGDVSTLAARDAYKEAFEKAKEHMKATDQTRLGLALNFSVFYYKIFNDRQEAFNMAKTAFDEAGKELESLAEEAESYKESTLIMQLLRDNLALWKPTVTPGGEGEAEPPVPVVGPQ